LPLKNGKYVKIAIKDSGIGIPHHHVSKIFDPYFTTKQKGSGLGLATSYSIIKKHGGILDVTSELGAGSTFFIYLPASEKKLPAAKAEVEGLLTGKGRILVMDDEEIIRIVTGQMLRTLGYEVVFTENGEQAVEKYSEAIRSNKPFDAVILDLTIRGGMGGQETVKKMIEIDPAIKAIVSSGYTEGPIVSHYMDEGFKARLSKPYEIEELSKTLNRILMLSDK
jgi:CheY-like chemotaxis protein